MKKYFKETKTDFVLSPGSVEHELLFPKKVYPTLELVIEELAKTREVTRKEIDEISRIASKIEDLSIDASNLSEELLTSF